MSARDRVLQQIDAWSRQRRAQVERDWFARSDRSHVRAELIEGLLHARTDVRRLLAGAARPRTRRAR